MFKKVEFAEFPQINEWMFPKLTVILIGGKAGVGKTTAANFMEGYLRKYATVYTYIGPFAKGVKDVARMLGWDGKKDAEGRKLLQDVGNFGREINKDVWINYLMNYIDNNIPSELLDVLVVDDWRFPNEADFFRKDPKLYNLFTLYIKSPQREILRGTREGKDISETALNNYKFLDYIIHNDKDIDGYREDVENVLLDIISESKKGGRK